ncbi:ABC transporter permease [Allokutzneria sp. A3M-2-11 16]|uniref:ABC transporter permease n=1 Tax=Allokutzneria sp. A3M-2-11 16 TaxID=2962043 RepID=UPI0020B8D876|nr:ABC transporter permease [Allokutzneria sp. A3M-2-11 16]MCP3804076.1 ABC transporter permease [Allokutzneria sp. A3M-2-11 16]
MLRRNLLHARRYPSMTISTVAMPVLMLLLFVGVFGGALGTGIGGASYIGSYVDYVAPGIILMAATSGSVATAVSVSVDMTEGIVNRFRTMAISRSSVLTGHVIGGVIQTMVSIALVVGVALLMGFRPTAGPLDWLGAFGLLLAMTFAMTWLAAAFGLVSKGPESASNAPMPLMFLPMLGSGFVPPERMPGAVRWFAEHQPFTPIIETLRGLLMGTPLVGGTGALALGWCALIALIGFLWARRAFSRAVAR